MKKGIFARASLGKKYERVAARLRREIRDLGLKVGDRLPSERVLSQHFKMAPATVRQGLEVLAREGAVRREANRGTFVARAANVVPDAARSVAGPDDQWLSAVFTRPRCDLTFHCRDCLPRQLDFWRQAIALAERRLPGLRVHVEPDESRPADVMMVSPARIPGLLAAGGVRVFPGAAVASRLEADALLPLAWDGARGEEEVYGIPVRLSACATLCNPGLWPGKGAGGRRRGGSSAGPPLVAGFIHVIYHQLLLEGIPVYDWDGHVDLRLPEVAEVLRRNREMFRRCRTELGLPADMAPGHLWNAFFAGRLAGIDSFSYAFALMPAKLDFTLRVRAACPPGKELVAAVPGVMAVSSACGHPELALDFAATMAGPEAQELLGRSVCAIPARRESLAAYGRSVPVDGMEELTALVRSGRRSMFSRSPFFVDLALEREAVRATLAWYRDESRLAVTVRRLQDIAERMVAIAGRLRAKADARKGGVKSAKNSSEK